MATTIRTSPRSTWTAGDVGPHRYHPDVSLSSGDLFAGYRILGSVGSGGMGQVYLAQHPRLPRRDALKLLRADVSAAPDYRARFEREADLAANLWHPHIVGVHDRGDVDGQLWIAMDYVDGTDAARLVRDHHPHGMPLAEVLTIVVAVADALDYAHQQGLLHRDVKPANILLTDPRAADRRVLLADFGIARSINDTSGLTATNVTVGSVAYAAPEQLTGAPLDGRADQYALACTAFHLLTGAPPFVNSNPAVVIGNHLSAPAPRLATMRPDLASLDAVLARAMAKEPAQRFPTCRAFAAALNCGEPTQLAVPVAAPRPAPLAGPPGRRAGLIVAGVAALLAVGAVAFIGGAKLGPTESAPVASSTHSMPPASATAPHTVTYTQPPVVVTAPPPARNQQPSGDLGLTQPISYPPCNGQGIVVLGSVTTPGLYAAGVQRLLDAHPGAFYLRTDQSCPSLRAATAAGNPIYAVFKPAGSTRAQVCAAVRTAGGGAYGKWLDVTSEPEHMIDC